MNEAGIMNEAGNDLRVERDGAVVRLTLNRPQAMNTYTPGLVRALTDAVAAVHDDRSR